MEDFGCRVIKFWTQPDRGWDIAHMMMIFKIILAILEENPKHMREDVGKGKANVNSECFRQQLREYKV